MLIDAEYNEGQIQRVRPLRVAHQRFLIQVLMPDTEILQEPAKAAPNTIETTPRAPESPFRTDSAAQLKQLMEALFGDGYRHAQTATDRDILTEVLSEKHA